ncbi:MAG: zeta toxin family protein [Candidatus Omnitrophica bacterium]|nr:zeta toxin family protein [Candidatus Omnitrophota bacterium]
MKTKNLYIIAGPNGSGKTTFAKKFLPLYAHCENFINADLIAQGLSPFSPSVAAMKAGRLVLQEIRGLAAKGADFAFETTLSGKTYLSFLKALKSKGYQIHLFFLWIPSAELALGRIKDRVAGGGHDVPAVDVRRRFHRSSYNFLKFYRPLLDSWYLFDNSTAAHCLVAKEKGGKLSVTNAELFMKISKAVE